jgi:uncharacterized membrane protein YtjA (UPF0391 family)
MRRAAERVGTIPALSFLTSRIDSKRRIDMLFWAFVLLIVGAIAALLGFGGLASVAIGAAKGLIFLKVLGIILLLAAVGVFVRHLMLPRTV